MLLVISLFFLFGIVFILYLYFIRSNTSYVYVCCNADKSSNIIRIHKLISGQECSPAERLIFEKLTGYEPFGVTSNLLFRGDSSTQGITAECVRRCQTRSNCRSFVLDHQRFECSSVQDPPNIHPADFRSAIGKTVFGGLCVPGKFYLTPDYRQSKLLLLFSKNPLDLIK